MISGKGKRTGRKPRKKNFTSAEKRALAGFVKEHAYIPFGEAGHCSQKVNILLHYWLIGMDVDRYVVL